MLRDLEEMLLDVKTVVSRNYLREAITCYHTGSYRAAVVLAYAAGIDDLWRRLEALRESGGASKRWKDVATSIREKRNEQLPCEREIIALADKHADVITAAERKKLEALIEVRHLCAHPSGHQGSPEEAREMITSIADIVLCRPLLSGVKAVEDLLDRLVNGVYFFPQDNDATTKVTVKGELQRISSRHYVIVTHRLVESLKNLVRDRKLGELMLIQETQSFTARARFLRGMALAGGEFSEPLWTDSILNQLLSTVSLQGVLYSILEMDPDGFGQVDELVRARILAWLQASVGTPSARTVISRLLDQNLIREDERPALEKAVHVEFLIGKVSSESAEAVALLPFDSAKIAFVKKVVADAGSGDFYVSKAAINVMQELSDDLLDLLTPRQKAQYVLNVARSADGGTYRAKDLVEDGLSARTDFADAFISLISDENELQALRTDWEQLITLLHNSGRRDVIVKTLKVLARSDSWPLLQRLDGMTYKMKTDNDPEIATIAKQIEEKSEALRAEFIASINVDQ